jgi:hypothetical protein
MERSVSDDKIKLGHLLCNLSKAEQITLAATSSSNNLLSAIGLDQGQPGSTLLQGDELCSQVTSGHQCPSSKLT